MKEELPETIALANGARLTLSSKADCYYLYLREGLYMQGRHVWPDLQAQEGPGELQATWPKHGSDP